MLCRQTQPGDPPPPAILPSLPRILLPSCSLSSLSFLSWYSLFLSLHMAPNRWVNLVGESQFFFSSQHHGNKDEAGGSDLRLSGGELHPFLFGLWTALEDKVSATW